MPTRFLVIMQSDKGIRIGEPAPVHPLKDIVKMSQFPICDDTLFEILKHAAAAAHRDAQMQTAT